MLMEAIVECADTVTMCRKLAGDRRDAELRRKQFLQGSQGSVQYLGRQ